MDKGDKENSTRTTESDKLKAFQNFLTDEALSKVRNSTDSDEIIREALTNYIKKRKVLFHLNPCDDPIYDKSANGDTLLYAAFKAGYYDVVRFALSEFEGKFNSECKDDMIHFHIACVTNNFEAAEAFLQGGIDPNVPLRLDSAEYSDLRPLEFAIAKNYFQLFVILVWYDADISTKNDRGQISLLHTIYHSSLPNNGKSWIAKIAKSWIREIDKIFINSKDEYGVSYFHLCCISNKPDLVQAFIDNGANVNDSISEKCPSNPGFTPLHFAVVNCSENIVTLLLRNGADPNKSDANGRTPLHFACAITENFDSNAGVAKLLKLIKTLISNNANPVAADKKGFTPLHLSFYAAEDGTWDIVDFVMKTIKTKINYTDEHGLSLFHMACARPYIKSVQEFLKSGVDVNSRVSSGIYGGLTPLYFAAMHYQKDIINVLLYHGANAILTDDEINFTPLHYAGEKYDPSDKNIGVQMMLKWKAKARTPLHVIFYGAIDGDFEMVNELITSKLFQIQWGADNCTDEQGLSLFHIACTTGDVYQVRKFLNAGANIDSRPFAGSLSGFTPLHLAVIFKKRTVVKFLLERNAKVNEKAGEYGITPLHLACEFRFSSDFLKGDMTEKIYSTNPVEIIKLLLLHGADVNAKDSYGNTPLLYLCKIAKNYMEANVPKWVSVANRNMWNSMISVKLQEIIKIFISYKANVNAVDSAGLTPLHVAVTNSNINLVKCLLELGANPNIKCSKSRIPLQIFGGQNGFAHRNSFKSQRIIFLALMENNSDVNVRNQRGEILLHEAVRSLNEYFTESLLKYGADINIEDSFGSVCCQFEKLNDRIIWHPTITVILLHLRWLEALKLPISQKVKNCQLLLQNSRLRDPRLADPKIPDEMYIKYCAELDVMKNVKIDKYTSLYDVLRKCPRDLINLVRNKNLIEAVNDKNVGKKFPLYSHWLKLQFKKGLIRKEVAESADLALYNILNKSLPNVCLHEVLKYLTNEELVILIEAADRKKKTG